MTVEKSVSSPGAWHQRKTLRIGATIAAAIVLLAVVLAWTYWPFSTERVARSIEEEFAGKVTFGHFRTTVFPHPGGVAEDVDFRWQTNTPDNAPLVTIRKLTIQAHYWDLVLRPKYVAHVALEGLRIHVPPKGSGTRPMDIPSTSTGTRIGEVLADEALLQIARRDEQPLNFAIHSLKLRFVQEGAPFSYEIAVKNPLPPGEARLNGKFGPWNSSRPDQTAVYGKYSFDDADLGVFRGIAGILSSQGEFQGTLGHMEAKGKIAIPNFEVTRSNHTVPVKSEYHAIVNAMNGDVTLQRVDSTVLKTRVLAKGSIEGRKGADGKFASIDLAVDKGRIQDVLRVFSKAPKPPLNGATGFRAHVELPPGDAPFLKKVILVGDFGVADAQFTKPKTQESVTELSIRGGGKNPEEEQEDPDNFVSNLSGHVELRGGIATFTDFRFIVPDAKATMHGTYNVIDERVDLHGILRTTAKFSETTGGFKSVLLKFFDPFFKRKKGGGKVPVQLTGTYSDPHPALDLM